MKTSSIFHSGFQVLQRLENMQGKARPPRSIAELVGVLSPVASELFVFLGVRTPSRLEHLNEVVQTLVSIRALRKRGSDLTGGLAGGNPDFEVLASLSPRIS